MHNSDSSNDGGCEIGHHDCPASIIDKVNALSLSTFESLYLQPSSLLNFVPRRGASQYKITLQSARSISSSDLNACYSLVEQTLSAPYRTMSWGSKPTARKWEMRDVDMRYLIVRKRTPEKYGLGFSFFARH